MPWLKYPKGMPFIIYCLTVNDSTLKCFSPVRTITNKRSPCLISLKVIGGNKKEIKLNATKVLHYEDRGISPIEALLNIKLFFWKHVKHYLFLFWIKYMKGEKRWGKGVVLNHRIERDEYDEKWDDIKYNIEMKPSIRLPKNNHKEMAWAGSVD